MSRMVSHVYDHLFSPGWSGGYRAYRQGADDSKVYNPARRPKVAKNYLNHGIVTQVVEILRGAPVDVSAWSMEAETRTGLRRAMIADGLAWQAADDTAAEVIRRAFEALRLARRPDFDEGQRYATYRDRQCLWCATELEHPGRFCSAEHARLALDHFDYEVHYAASPIGRAAYRIIRRDREEERVCAREACGHTFRPMSADSAQKYCGPLCKQLDQVVTLPSRDCEYCGAPFQPKERSQRFCMQAHATAALTKPNEIACQCCGTMFKPRHGEDPERDKYCSRRCADQMRATPKHLLTCDWCDSPFMAKTRAARFCCDAHAQAHRKAARGILPAKIGPPVFDFVFAVAA